MLRFSNELDECALAILHAALTDALEETELSKDDPDGCLEDFTARYPQSAKCFTAALAETTLKDLLRTSQDSALYQLTDYHWLLLYEVLKNFTEVFNDEPELVAGEELVARYGVKNIDISEFIDLYFWDMDFLADPNDVIMIGEAERKSMGFSPEAYGVIQRWAPHSEELALTKVEPAT